MTRAVCGKCGNRGLIALRYRSGEPVDLLVCTCAAGAYWLARGEATIRARYQLDASQHVGSLADVKDEAYPPVEGGDFRVAGQVAPKAKL